MQKHSNILAMYGQRMAEKGGKWRDLKFVKDYIIDIHLTKQDNKKKKFDIQISDDYRKNYQRITEKNDNDETIDYTKPWIMDLTNTDEEEESKPKSEKIKKEKKMKHDPYQIAQQPFNPYTGYHIQQQQPQMSYVPMQPQYQRPQDLQHIYNMLQQMKRDQVKTRAKIIDRVCLYKIYISCVCICI